jgi:signal transduction histidine kinase
VTARAGGRDAARDQRRFRQALLASTLGAVAFALWLGFEVGGPRVSALVDDVGTVLAAWAAALACFAAARRGPSGFGRAWTMSMRQAWSLLGLSAFAWGVGGVVWTWYEFGRGVAVPFPSWPDVFYLSAVPLAAAGVLSFPTAPALTAARLRTLLDGLVIAACLLAVSWATIGLAVYLDSDSTVAERVFGLAYPLGDIVTGTIALAVLARSRGRALIPLTLIALAVLALAVADSMFLYLTQLDLYGSGHVLDTGWVVGYLLLALSALRPAEARIGPEVNERGSLARVCLPYCALAAAIVTICVVQAGRGSIDLFLFWDAVAVIALVILRQLVMFVENRRLNQRMARTVDELSEREAQLGLALARGQAAAEGLRTADQMKDTFLRAVSHDLRNPLTAILGVALTLERTKMELPRDKGMELLGMLVDKAHKLDRLLTDLLDLNRLEHALLEPNRSRTDVGALVRQVVREVDQLQGWPVSVEVDDLTADVDGPKLERIVENLLVNTVRHTPPGTPVWIRAAAFGPDLELVIEDAGPGVPPELAGTIFEPFRRGSPGVAPGVGIGLSLVARFAQLHGGRAWVGERPGGGAAFHVLLPNAVPWAGKAAPPLASRVAVPRRPQTDVATPMQRTASAAQAQRSAGSAAAG